MYGCDKRHSEIQRIPTPNNMLSPEADSIKMEPGRDDGSDSDVEITHESRTGTRRTRIIMDKQHVDALAEEPMEMQLRKSVALTLDAQNMPMTPGFLDQVTELASEYFHNIIVELQKFTELQRRRRPSLTDVQLCFSTLGINHNAVLRLHEQITGNMTPQQHTYSRKIAEQSNTIRTESQDFTIEPKDPSYPFVANEKYEITAVVPQHHARPEYVPGHMPMLPPDYTYHRTPEYMPTISDLKTVRTKLVEESRMTEKWLYVLMKDNDKYKVDNNEIDVETDRISKEETEDTRNGEWNGSDDSDSDGVNNVDAKSQKKDTTEAQENGDTSISTHSVSNPKLFDIMAYARKRIASLERRNQNLEQKRKRRHDNIFMQAETVYSPYATKKPTKEVAKKFDDVLDAAFLSVLLLVKEGEKEKRRKLAAIEEDKKRRQEERELQADTLEFGALGNIGHSDDSDEEDEGFPEFDFPDNSGQTTNNWDAPQPETTPQNTVEERPTLAKKGLPSNDIPVEEPHDSDEDLEADLEDALGDLGAMS